MKTRIIAALVIIALICGLIIIAVCYRPHTASSNIEAVNRTAAEPSVPSSSDGLQRDAAPEQADVRDETTETVTAISRDDIMKARVSGMRDEKGWRRARALPLPAHGAEPVKVRTVEATAERITLAYRMPKAQLVSAGRPTAFAPKGTERVVLGNAPSRSRMGEPVVPVVTAAVLLPAGRDLEDIEVMALRRREMEGEHVLVPGRKPIPLDPGPEAEDPARPEAGQPAEEPAVDPRVYGSDNAYPRQRVEIVGVQKKRGVSLVLLNLLPVEYRPGSGKVAVYEEMQVQVKTKPAAAVSGVSPRYRPDLLAPVTMEVDNPETLATYEDAAPAGDTAPLGALCDPADSYAYVLVTSEAIRDALVTPSVQDLILHRRNHGLTATLVTIEDILGSYAGTDNAEKLRNFILDAYNNWETDYVLLGGDVAVVPMRKLWCEAYPNGPVDQIPSDLYFQCLDGTYDSDGDGLWGEPEDGPDEADVDMLAEVYIGRASAEDAQEMANWIYKTLAYESTAPNDPFLNTALMAGEYLGPNFGPGIFSYAKCFMEEIRLGASTAGYTTLGFAANPGVTVDTLYDYGLESQWRKEDIITHLDSDTYSIINHLGHANFNYVMRFYNEDADRLMNEKFFFLNSQGCIPGAFDQDCMSEHLTTSTRHGAFAVVLNSRYGWGYYNDDAATLDAPSQRLQRQFWHASFADFVQELGALNALSHERNLWGVNDDCVRWCVYEANLQGDPAAKLAAVPQNEYLIVKTVTADDGDDGLVNPGETADLAVRVINLGLEDAENVTGTLSVSDEYVTITDAEASFGTVAGMGGEGDSVPRYGISVDAGCPTPRRVDFTLAIQSGSGETWTNYFNIYVVRSCEISGIVRLDGAPAPGVTVTVWGVIGSATAVSGSQGTYSLITGDGTQFRQASKDGWMPTESVYFTVAGDMNNVNFDFTTATVSGTVVDGDGAGVPDATVTYEGGLSGEVLTAQDGSYSFSRVYGQTTTLTLAADKDGYFNLGSSAEVTVPPDATVNLVLPECWKVRGRVTWGGEGVPGFKIQSYAHLSLTWPTIDPTDTVYTDADGYYVLDRWPYDPDGYGFYCGVCAWGDPGMGYVCAAEYKYFENQDPDVTYNIAMAKPELRGTVTDVNGNPVPGVELAYAGQPYWKDHDCFVTRYYVEGTVTSEADGTYRIPVVVSMGQDVLLDVDVSKTGYASTHFVKTVPETGVVTRDVVLGKPTIGVGVTSLDVSAYPGALVTRSFTISNTGNAPLEYLVIKDADPAKAWEVIWEREMPGSMDFVGTDLYPELVRPYYTMDDSGHIWTLASTSVDEGQYIVELNPVTWEVLTSIRVLDNRYHQIFTAPTVSGNLVWWTRCRSQDEADGTVRAYNRQTGQQERDFVIPRRVLGARIGTDTHMSAMMADDGFLYVVVVGAAHGWADTDNIRDCARVRGLNRIIKMNPDSGAILDIRDSRRGYTGALYGHQFSLWNSMVMIPMGGTVSDMMFSSRRDWSDRLYMEYTECYIMEHLSDDACWYGVDPGPTSWEAADGGPKPTWGADQPTLYLRTSGVARWLGARLANRCGTVAPGGSVDVEVVVDASEATLGTHTSKLIIESNDPDQPLVEVPVNLTVGGIVDVLDVSTDGRYEVADVAVGTLCYTDRPYKILELDDSLAGGLLVRTADNDKYVTAAKHLALNVTEPATVSVCVDTRIGTLPAWLDGAWTDAGSGVIVETSDGAACPMRVYRKNVQAGNLVLGGNGVGTPDGDRSHYTVIVKPIN